MDLWSEIKNYYILYYICPHRHDTILPRHSRNLDTCKTFDIDIVKLSKHTMVNSQYTIYKWQCTYDMLQVPLDIVKVPSDMLNVSQDMIYVSPHKVNMWIAMENVSKDMVRKNICGIDNLFKTTIPWTWYMYHRAK
jgi:hypothetical protein